MKGTEKKNGWEQRWIAFTLRGVSLKIKQSTRREDDWFYAKGHIRFVLIGEASSELKKAITNQFSYGQLQAINDTYGVGKTNIFHIDQLIDWLIDKIDWPPDETKSERVSKRERDKTSRMKNFDSAMIESDWIMFIKKQSRPIVFFIRKRKLDF